MKCTDCHADACASLIHFKTHPSAPLQALRAVNSELSALEQKRAGLAAQKEALEAKLASLGATAEEPPKKKAGAKRGGGGGRTKTTAAGPAAKKKRSSSGGDSDEEWRP